MTTFTTDSTEEFGRRVKQYADRVQVIAKGKAGRIFIEIGKRIFEATPVLTGRARANWNASIDVPNLTTTTATAAVDTTGSPATGDEVSRLQAAVDAFVKGDSTKLVLANGLDYIGALDAGTSEKAPAGIVEPSITATLDALKDRGE